MQTASGLTSVIPLVKPALGFHQITSEVLLFAHVNSAPNIIRHSYELTLIFHFSFLSVLDYLLILFRIAWWTRAKVLFCFVSAVFMPS